MLLDKLVYVFLLLLNISFEFGSLQEIHDEAIQFGFRDIPAVISWDTNIDFCNNGTRQSPISLKDKYCTWMTPQPLTFLGHWDFRPEGIELRNTGKSVLFHTVGMKAPLMMGGPLKDNYLLQQMHFHWGDTLIGSEHNINGKFYGMEAHLVHFNSKYGDVLEAIKHKDGIAVVGIMFEATDEENPELNGIIQGLRNVREGESFDIIGGDILMWLRNYLENPSDYFSYHGSLTTHPCDEAVTWINLRQTSTVGINQIQQCRYLKGEDGFITSSRRSLQHRNGRTILCTANHVN